MIRLIFSKQVSRRIEVVDRIDRLDPREPAAAERILHVHRRRRIKADLALVDRANVGSRKSRGILDPNDTGVGPMPGVNGPKHLLRVVRIDIGVDSDDDLHPGMCGERGLQHCAGLAIFGLVDADDATEDMSGKPYVANICEWCDLLPDLQHQRHPEQHRVLGAARKDHVIDSVAPAA